MCDSTGISIIQMYQFLRNVYSAKLVALNGGTFGVIVQIDKSLFNHELKYDCDRAAQNKLWVCLMCDTSYTPFCGYMEIVKRRDATALMPIMEQHVPSGLITYFYQW